MHSYRDLLERHDAPPGSSWGLCGDLGTIAFLSEENVRAGIGCVRRGATFNLDWPINAFTPPISPVRHLTHHTIYQRHSNHRDDFLDSFYLQGTSQIDGLRHMRDSRYGFYNNTPDSEVSETSSRIGIGLWAEKGIVGRGVLVDLERHLQSVQARTLDHRAGEPFRASLVDAAAAAQGVRFAPGDILLLRTGWSRFYFEEMSTAERDALPMNIVSPGFLQDEETLQWLWDHQFSLVASDNVAVEALPVRESSPFFSENAAGMIHPALIALLGLALGELWRLDELAEDCANDGVYEFLVFAKPLNLIGGVGSPPNAMAIK